MAMDDLEVARTAMAGWATGDWSLTARAFSEDAVWHDHRRPDGLFRGHAGLRESYRSWVGTWQEYSIELEEPIRAGAGIVLGEFRERGVGKGSGLPVEHTGMHVIRVEDGQIVRVDTYRDPAEARAAARL